MAWTDYNEIIGAIMDAENLSYEDAREYYSELRDQGYEVDDIREMVGAGVGFDDLEDWIEHYDDGDYDDYPYDEIEGGIDYEPTGK